MKIVYGLLNGFIKLAQHRQYSIMTMSVAQFVYSDADFNYDVTWQRFSQQQQLSRLDSTLRDKWDEAMSRGYFRYQLGDVQTRILPGKYQYILKLNIQRAVERRTPQDIQSLHTPFDHTKFNFTRVKPDEILFELSNCWAGNIRQTSDDAEFVSHVSSADDDVRDGHCGRHVVMINVSPVEYGHVLLVPQIDHCLPQMLTETSIRLAIELLLLSSHPGWRVGFNSLGGLASVNHLHLHAWYLNEHLFTETASVRHICDDLYEIVDYPARGFAFQLYDNTVNSMASVIHRVASHIQSRGIAHNLFITRGSRFDVDSKQTKDDRGAGQQTSTVRAYLWPRKSFFGAKMDISEIMDMFNLAAFEMAGHIPIYKESIYTDVTEEYVNSRMREQVLDDDQWSSLTNDVVRRLQG